MSKWRILGVTEFADVVSGATPATNVKEYWDGGIEWITPADLSKLHSRFIKNSERTISYEGLRNSSVHLTPKNNIVMSSRAPIGYFAIPIHDFTTNQGCKTFILKDDHNCEYHYYNLFFYVEHIKRFGVGSTFAEISKTDIEKLTFKISIDPSEQRKIARILSTVDAVIEKTEAAIAKYKAINQGMMQDLFTRGLDKNGKLRPKYQDAPELYKKTELGWIPKEWEILLFDDVTKDYLDFRGRTPIKLKMKWGNGDIKAISANNVEMGKLNFSKEYYTGGDILYNAWMTKGDCSRGDVLMTSEAPLGCIAQIPDDRKYILSQRVILFKTDENKITNDFLYWFMMSYYFQNELTKNSSGSTVTGIQQAKLSNISIAIPINIPEQSSIADRLGKLQTLIDSELNYLNKIKQLKLALMFVLLTGKVLVKYEEE